MPKVDSGKCQKRQLPKVTTAQSESCNQGQMLKVANAQSDVCWCARIAWKKFRFQFFFSECFTLASNPPVSSAYDLRRASQISRWMMPLFACDGWKETASQKPKTEIKSRAQNKSLATRFKFLADSPARAHRRPPPRRVARWGGG